MKISWAYMWMWATVLVVYFIKFLYTVCNEGNYFLTGDNCETLPRGRRASAAYSTRGVICVEENANFSYKLYSGASSGTVAGILVRKQPQSILFPGIYVENSNENRRRLLVHQAENERTSSARSFCSTRATWGGDEKPAHAFICSNSKASERLSANVYTWF